MQISIGPER